MQAKGTGTPRSLEQGRDLVRRVAQASPNIVYIFDLETWNPLFINRRVEPMLGYTVAEVEAMGTLFVTELVHPEDRDRLPNLRRRYHDAEDEAILELEFRMRHADGTWRWVHNRTAVFSRDDDGAPVQIIGTIEDVTRQHVAKEAIARAHHEMRDVIENMPDAVMLFREGKIVFVNSAGVRLLAADNRNQLKGRVVLDLIHEDDRDAARKRIAEMELSDSRMPPREARMLRARGEPVQVEVSGGQSIMFEGEHTNLVVIRDVTERKKLQARLLLADRMVSVGTLASGIAHEINNPLAYVIGNLGYLQQSLSRLVAANPELDLAEIVEAVDEARDGGERVQAIVADLRTFSRGDDATLGPVDVHTVLESSLKLASKDLSRRAQLVKEFGEVPPVRAGESRLGQVFLNLIVNAIQAIPAESRPETEEVRIRTWLEDGRVAVSIADSGPGIPGDILDRVFDPFFTTKPVGIGTGLGLSICHSIVTSLGGEIHVESGGSGTTFVVLLPADVPTAPRQTLPGRAIDASATSILIVDDEPIVARSLRRALPSYDVVTASSGEEALALCLDREFDVVLCDMMMPGLDGKAVYGQLAKARPGYEHRIAFMSGGPFSESDIAFLDAVDTEHLHKPFLPERVHEVVRRVLTRIRGDHP